MPFALRLVPLLLALLFVSAACVKGHRRPPADQTRARAASPLGGSYVLIPVPSDDDSLLGRVLRQAPQPGRALQEFAAPNPCLSLLEPAREVSMTNDYEDAEEVGYGNEASAMLGSFGFGGGAKHATHFLYKIQTQKKVFHVEDHGFSRCCQAANCGYGYVAELVYGEGEYAAGEETSVRGNVDVAFASAGGDYSLKLLQRKKVKGYMAAIVKVFPHAAQQNGALGPLGVAAKAGLLKDLSGEVRERYDQEQIKIVSVALEDNKEGWAFADRDGNITENEFIRRYGEVTGSDALDDQLSRKNTSKLIMNPILAVGFGALGYWGTKKLIDCHQPEGSCNGWYWTGAFTGGLMAAAGVGVFIDSLLQPDGNVTDHSIDKGEAARHIRTYNRRLVPHVVREVERDRREDMRGAGVEVQLTIGMGSVGVVGSF